MNSRFINHTDSNAYKLSDSLSDEMWNIVMSWDWFAKRTVGVQIISAFDSIPANITEGFGRHHKKDRQKFYYNARGSAYESLFWTEKAFKRNLIPKTNYEKLISMLTETPKEINWLIKVTEEKLKE